MFGFLGLGLGLAVAALFGAGADHVAEHGAQITIPPVTAGK